MAVKLALSLVVMSDTIVICLFVVFYAVSRGFPLAQNIRFSMFRTTTSSISCSENFRLQPHFLLRSGSLQSKLGTNLSYSRFELVSGRPDCKCPPHIFRYPGEHRGVNLVEYQDTFESLP